MIDFLNSDKTVIIAELSCNHIQSYDIAVKTIRAMAEVGVDVVKVQNDKADGGVTINCDKAPFQIKGGTLWDGETLFSLYTKTDTPWEWIPKLQQLAHSLGMGFFSTPSDPSGVDFLEQIDVPCYKISSFEITDLGLIEKAARTGKMIIMSTGIATEEDIRNAIDTCRSVGNDNILLMKCTSSYPAPIDAANLSMIPDMKRRFGVRVGLSDHSMGHIVATTAVALGAEMIEKHFILDRRLGGPDSAFSMEPEEFRIMIESIRNVEKSIGKVDYTLSERTLKNRDFAKSLFVVADVKEGDVLTEDNVKAIRPFNGILPKYLKDVLGKTFVKSVERGTPLSFDLLK
ncbi:pseudaminic acid synthase [Bacteroides helcogenes]|uniref:N-acetylneuraminate synthase n=1 Tax=Bacteroides helcogenes (strain ATCC 35417 / DSM 20613 / JCM 6297 / CCUG 15421 / P 36-108) TaxID=693979 RepID=E6SQ67_BACT6|nr:pseudaminic acid synthase [Bacteroides helcogenes]ADV43926.1 N-acetylneuraminate synthase [Bacteroides helcogenes P 36-108]MDY5237367.1 pseudaminic acid synthase [Bacteroides helcogenes]